MSRRRPLGRFEGRRLREHSPADPLGAVLFLHGGREVSDAPVRAYRLAVVRVRLIEWSTRRRFARARVAAWTLRLSVRGWNGDGARPVGDARWALDQIAARPGGPLPVVIIGHSMGGRTAVHVADAPGVIGVVGLAPWLPSGEAVTGLRGRMLAIAHGTADRTTDPRRSAAFAERARAVASSVTFERIEGDGHALLRKPRRWNRFCVREALRMLGTVHAEGAQHPFSGG